MNTLIFFDTNFLFSRPTKAFVEALKDNQIFCYTSEYVINELKGQNRRKIKSAHDSLTKAEKDHYILLYFETSCSPELEDVFLESDKRIDACENDLFGKNIIPFGDKNADFDILMERNRKKVPPFCDEENASDKGFNDTLIWVSFINYCFEQRNNFDSFVFVSHDGIFKKYIEDLEEEFYLKVNKKVEIQNYSTMEEIYTRFGISSNQSQHQTFQSKKEDFAPKEAEEKTISQEFVRKVQNIVGNFLFVSTPSVDYLSDPINAPTFYLKKPISDENLISFCDLLVKKESCYTFSDTVNLSELLEELKIASHNGQPLPVQCYQDFVSIWKEISVNYPSAVSSFIFYLKQIINTGYFIQSENDLPF